VPILNGSETFALSRRNTDATSKGANWVNGTRAAALLEVQLAIGLFEAIRIVGDAILKGKLPARKVGEDEPLLKEQWQAEADKQEDLQISLPDCEVTLAGLYRLVDELKRAKPPSDAHDAPKGYQAIRVWKALVSLEEKGLKLDDYDDDDAQLRTIVLKEIPERKGESKPSRQTVDRVIKHRRGKPQP
jgi:hypothetical protein